MEGDLWWSSGKTFDKKNLSFREKWNQTWIATERGQIDKFNIAKMLLFSYNKFLHNLKNATSKVTYEFSIQDDEKCVNKIEALSIVMH